MLDRDVGVIVSCIHSLNSILSSEGGMAINTQIIMYLLNRIKEFNEWGQCAVLELVAKYKPNSDQEMFDIMVTKKEKFKQFKYSCKRFNHINETVQTNMFISIC